MLTKNTRVKALILSLFITLALAVVPVAIDGSNFERGKWHVCVVCSVNYPPGVVGMVLRGIPIPYYVNFNVLPDPTQNQQNISIAIFLADWGIWYVIIHWLLRRRTHH